MSGLSIIAAGFVLSGCSSGESTTATEAAAMAAVQREFGPTAVISNAIYNGARGSAVMCGYVTAADAPAFPRAAFIWTAARFDVSRWDDARYAEFDRRAREVCGASWVAPKRVPAVS